MKSPEAEAETERVRLKNVSIKKLLNEEFINEIDGLNLDLVPVTLALIPKNGGEPIIISHANPKDVDDHIAHITCLDEANLMKVKKILIAKEKSEGID